MASAVSILGGRGLRSFEFLPVFFFLPNFLVAFSFHTNVCQLPVNRLTRPRHFFLFFSTLKTLGEREKKKSSKDFHEQRKRKRIVVTVGNEPSGGRKKKEDRLSFLFVILIICVST